MLKGQRILWGKLALLLLFSSLIGCSSTLSATSNPTAVARPTTTPTPTPVPKVRVIIQLDDVICNHKQSFWWWQKDTFYMLTTFSATGPSPASAPVTQAHISDPIAIGNHDDLAIPPGPLVVFDALLPIDGTIRGGFTTFNGGVSDDQISQFATWAGPIAEKVGDKLQEDSIDSENLYIEAGATILDVAIHVFFGLVKWSNNIKNQLGTQPIEITANGPQVDPETLTFVQNNGAGQTWNYLIHYTITRTFTNSTS